MNAAPAVGHPCIPVSLSLSLSLSCGACSMISHSIYQSPSSLPEPTGPFPFCPCPHAWSACRSWRSREAAAAAEAEEEECECGFCLFMKAGGCKDAYVALEECFEAAQKEGADFDERCYEVTANLRKCMDAHAHYYLPVLLRAVRVAGEEV